MTRGVRQLLTIDDEGGGGVTQKLTIADEGGGEVCKPPNVADVIYEQPLIEKFLNKTAVLT